MNGMEKNGICFDELWLFLRVELTIRHLSAAENILID